MLMMLQHVEHSHCCSNWNSVLGPGYWFSKKIGYDKKLDNIWDRVTADKARHEIKLDVHYTKFLQ